MLLAMGVEEACSDPPMARGIATKDLAILGGILALKGLRSRSRNLRRLFANIGSGWELALIILLFSILHTCDTSHASSSTE